jgi:hypothetical protein
MREHDYYVQDDEDPWEGVRLTKEGIRARATLIVYSVLLSVPFVVLVASGGLICGGCSPEGLPIYRKPYPLSRFSFVEGEGKAETPPVPPK